MNLLFDIRLDLDEAVQQNIELDVRSFLEHHQEFETEPRKVIVSRASSDPRDQRILAVLRGTAGEYLGSITGEANWAGALVFKPPD